MLEVKYPCWCHPLGCCSLLLMLLLVLVLSLLLVFLWSFSLFVVAVLVDGLLVVGVVNAVFVVV